VNTIFVHRNGTTEQTTRIDRAWLNPASGATLWVDLAAPSIPESLLLSDTFAFHPLAVEDALSPRERPRIDAYDGYLLVVLTEVRMFVGRNFLVSVSGGGVPAVEEMRDNVAHNPRLLADGSVALCHRIADELADAYEQQVRALRARLDALTAKTADRPAPGVVAEILSLHGDLLTWRARMVLEADVVCRLARRDFIDVSTEMALRFRDVHDHLMSAADELGIGIERVGSLLTVASAMAGGSRRWI
jgi:magnesium transporter